MPPRLPARRDVIALAMAPLLLLAADRFYVWQHAELMVQSELNLRFVTRPFVSALERYPRLHPPFYPVVLWAATRAGVPVERVNELLLFGLLGMVAFVCRRHLGRVHYLVPLLAFLVLNPLYVNLHQYTSEAVFAPLLLALVLLLAAYLQSGSEWHLLLVAGAVSLLCLTRYFGLLLALPLVLANVVLLSPARGPRRRLHAALTILVGGGPILLWMVLTKMQTGFWTGTDRGVARHLPESVKHWAELTTLAANLRLTVKTLFVDFFSPWAYAAHSVVTVPYRLSPAEWASVCLLILCAVSTWRLLQAPRPAGVPPAVWDPRTTVFLIAELLVAYLTWTIALWTIGNNDPVYTRFLFPAYPLILIGAFCAYDAIRPRARSRWELLPFGLLLADYLVVQAVRSFRADALPVRYFS